MPSNETRYVCNLSPAILAKAVAELNEPEDNTKRLAAIDEIKRGFLGNTEGLTLMKEDDIFLLRFLRARKFDMARSLALLKNYHKQRSSWKEVFDKVNNPSRLVKVFDAGCICGSLGKAKDSSAIVLGRPGKLSGMSLTDFVAAVFLSVETLLDIEENQVYGITVIQDMYYLNFGFVRQIGPSLASRFLGLLQDCLPIRLKSVNVVNEPMLFDIAFAIIGPFMKEKTKKRFTIHGQEYSGLHSIIDPQILPDNYNGSGNAIDVEGWKNTVLERFKQ
uniref:Alpha-tocopherol transfer protein-like n=1 Tax=Phallusia mammillata TaxID=59560 RepID=A0A6F9DWG6_9ASCI|nr:alpha-tocopherol transfer protein-like [Phallusia mammillata]